MKEDKGRLTKRRVLFFCLLTFLVSTMVIAATTPLVIAASEDNATTPLVIGVSENNVHTTFDPDPGTIPMDTQIKSNTTTDELTLNTAGNPPDEYSLRNLMIPLLILVLLRVSIFAFS